MSESKAIIGTTAVVRGQIEGQEDLLVAGRVEGTISLSETLIVETGGVVQADINVRSVVIHGVLIGNIEASQAVRIGSEGRVLGDISAPEVIIEEGAAFRGLIDMGDFDLEERADTTSVMPHTKPAIPALKQVAPPPGSLQKSTPSLAAAPKTSSFAPRYAGAAPPPDAHRRSAGGQPSVPPWDSGSVSRVPVPRPSVSASPPAASRPAAPPTPKVRNIGRAKARRQPR
jgi:cytoskeletal protein CcmA (bactofilin family)